MSTKLLIIGAAHLDIVADYNEKDSLLDKRGKLNISLGGSAYNIVANLCSNNYRISFLTALNSASISGEIIHNTLTKLNINTDYIINTPIPRESGFVAFTKDYVNQSTVSSTLIEKVDIGHKLSKAIPQSDVIVIDCNLSKSQIEQIVNISSINKLPIFVCAVSVMKMREATEISNKTPYPYYLFSMNNLEATEFLKFKRIKKNWEEINNEKDVANLCYLLKSKNVVITNGSEGYKVFSYNGTTRDFKVQPLDTKYSLGAGDALLSAIVDHYITNGKTINWDNCQATINYYTNIVLHIPEATRHAKYIRDYPEYFGEPIHENSFDIFGIIPYDGPYLDIWEKISSKLTQEENINIGIAADLSSPTTIIRDIWSQIYYSKCIIADCSERNPNVFYELGIAHSLGKKVICITNNTQNIPFDINQIRCLKYKNTDDGINILYRAIRNNLKDMKII